LPEGCTVSADSEQVFGQHQTGTGMIVSRAEAGFKPSGGLNHPDV
jgi:hypothetical protein